ncbi:MAG: DUF6531 domain-containing protein [Rhodothermales bacterium]
MTLRADIATGETSLDRTDLRLGGALPLVLARQYRSSAPAGIFGVGWRHGLDRTLRVMADRIVYREGSGREVVFAPVAVGMEVRHPEGLTLQHHADVWVVFASPLAQEVFRKRTGGDALPLERIVDPNGNRIKLGYAGGRLAEISGSGGQRIRFTYAGGVVGQIVVVGADGRASAVRTFRYGAGNTLVAETDAAGRTTEYAYQDGLLVRAGPWLAQYGSDRRCLAVWRSDGTAATHLAYDLLRQTTRAVGLDGRQTLYRHAPGTNGQVVLERLDTGNESLNYYYDEAQQLIGHSDPGGTVVTFQRLDPAKGERFQIDYEDRFSNATLGPGGLVEAMDGPGEGVFAFGYDERFSLTQLTTPLGATWRFERDGKGRASAIVSPAGRRIALRREGAALLVEGEEGLRLRLTSDLFGRVAARTDRLGREQRFRYDAEGRLIGVAVGDGYSVAWDYDGAGRLTRIVDAERVEVRRTHDAAGRVLTAEAGRGGVRFAYDLAGRISAAEGAGGKVGFAYDEQDRLVRAEGPGGTMTYDYDGDGVAVTTGDRRAVYSAHGEPLEEHAADGSARRFQYGATGELLAVEHEAEDETTTLLFDYDDDGRLIGAERGDAAATFGYDPDGLLTTVETGGRTFRLEHDTRLRPALLRVGETAYRFTFDDGDRLTAFARDGEGRSAPDSSGGDSAPASDETLPFASVTPYAPQPDSPQPAVPPPASCTFQYDALDRCTSFRTGDGAEQRTTVGGVDRVPVGDGLAFVVAPRGLALVLETDALVLPLWGGEEMRLPRLALDARIVRALVRGPEAALVSPNTQPGPPVERWQTLARAEGFETGVPSATALGLPWPTLDVFALARDRYDPHFARRLAGSLPHHQPDTARAPDDALTGSHRTGVLHPPVWAERAHGRHLASALLAPPGGVPDTLALRLYRTLTRP